MEIEMMLRILNFTTLSGAFLLVIISSLVSLRRRKLPYKNKLISTFAILFFPLLGSMNFCLVNPQNDVSQRRF
jgi:hypothetical protein